jgi:hypothetical protein
MSAFARGNDYDEYMDSHEPPVELTIPPELLVPPAGQLDAGDVLLENRKTYRVCDCTLVRRNDYWRERAPAAIARAVKARSSRVYYAERSAHEADFAENPLATSIRETPSVGCLSGGPDFAIGVKPWSDQGLAGLPDGVAVFPMRGHPVGWPILEDGRGAPDSDVNASGGRVVTPTDLEPQVGLLGDSIKKDCVRDLMAEGLILDQDDPIDINDAKVFRVVVSHMLGRLKSSLEVACTNGSVLQQQQLAEGMLHLLQGSGVAADAVMSEGD